MELWRRQTCLTKCRLLVDTCVIILMIGSLLAVHTFVKPRRRGFFCNDDSIKYPYAESTVSNDVIVSITLTAPVLMLLTELLSRKCLRTKNTRRERSSAHTELPRLWESVVTYLVYVWGYLALTMLLLMLKTTTGQLRPHFLTVCQPDVDLVTCRGYVADYNCTNTMMTDKDLNTARQSFPSGHAASAVYMAVFMIVSLLNLLYRELYMEVRLKIRHFRLVKLTSHVVLTSYALWVSATRVSDHMHHISDVVIGGLLGLLLAVVTYTRGAIHSLHNKNPPCPDVESNAAAADHTYRDDKKISVAPDNFDNDNNEDEEEDNLTSLEAEVPDTPTPLLTYSTSNHVGSATDLKTAPFKLEGNKHKFARKTKSSVYY